MPTVADFAIAAGRLAFAARLDTLCPHLVWICRLSRHVAFEAIGTRGLLTLGAIHLRAYRGTVLERDTLLIRGASACRARGEAQGLGNGVRAEEALGATLPVAQAARPGAPSAFAATAQPARSAGVPLVIRKFDATLAFLAWAHGDAAAHIGPTSPGGKNAADLVFQTLCIRQTRAVGACRPQVAAVEQAAQRRFALSVWTAPPAIRHQSHALLASKYGADAHPGWHLRWYLRPQKPPQQQQQWEWQEHADEHSPPFAPTTPFLHLRRPSALETRGRVLLAIRADLPAPCRRAALDHEEVFLRVLRGGLVHAAVLAEFRRAAPRLKGRAFPRGAAWFLP
jgi:hypothetical protein